MQTVALAAAGAASAVTDWSKPMNSTGCRARLAEEHAFMKATGKPTGFFCKSRPVLFSPSRRLAYVKTPKGASLAIQDLFQKQFTDYRWAEAHEELPEGTVVFTFVREPLKRAMSAYAEIDVAYALRASPEVHMAMRTAFDKVPRKSGARETPRVLAFLDDLVDHRFGGEDREHWMPTHAYSQLNYICQHRIDYVGHLENQDADWAAIQEIARLPPALRTPFPHAHDSSVHKSNATNASVTVCNRACELKAADQKAPLTPALLQRLCDIFASDFLCLGYSMPAGCQSLPMRFAAADGAPAPSLNGTPPMRHGGSNAAHAATPWSALAAPVYLMAQLDAETAWHVLRESPTYRNSLFIVPTAAENRSSLFRLKRASNHSFAPAATSAAKLLRDFDRFGWYWRGTHGSEGGSHGGAAAAGVSPDLPRAPLAVALPVRSLANKAFAEVTAEARSAVERALAEAQQELLLHRYDRVVVVGHDLVPQGDGSTNDGFSKFVVDAISRRLVDPLATAAAPPRQAGGWSPSARSTNSSAPHKHFLPGRRD